MAHSRVLGAHLLLVTVALKRGVKCGQLWLLLRTCTRNARFQKARKMDKRSKIFIKFSINYPCVGACRFIHDKQDMRRMSHASLDDVGRNCFLLSIIATIFVTHQKLKLLYQRISVLYESEMSLSAHNQYLSNDSRTCTNKMVDRNLLQQGSAGIQNPGKHP